jgi:hypothetical protein
MKPLLLVSTLFAAATLAAQAQAGKAPVLGVDVGQTGVVSSGGSTRFVTLPARGRTVLAAVARPSGKIVAYRTLPGRYTIPAVAYDGTASGLSADGRTLVLTRPRFRFAQTESPFLVVDSQRLRARQRLTLAGNWSFDAISPDGKSLYLIQYTNRRDSSRYAVRMYDLARGRLDPRPVVDPHEPDEVMRGLPLSRRSSSDGRWAYTLYDGGGSTPFIHALDTVGRTARCIDLDALAVMIGGDMSQLRMRLRGDELVVDAGGEPFVLVDTQTFAVREAAAVSASKASASPSARPDETAWWIPALAAGGLATVLGIALVRRRPRLTPGASRARP